MRHVDRLLNRLQNVRPQGPGYIACCPAHDDANPSLGITVRDDGHIRLHCRSAHCSLASILHAIDLTPADLDPDPDDDVIVHRDIDLIAGEPEGRRNGVVPDEADLNLRDRVYRAVLYELSLTDQHREDLRRRGVPDEQMVLRGYRSLTGPSRSAVLTALQSQFSPDELLAVPGFVRRDDGALAIVASFGMLIPVLDLLGRVVAIKVRRDVVAGGDTKYGCMSGGGGPSCGTPTHVPLGTQGPISEVRITEGELKADIATILSGLPTIGIPGVSNWPSALPALQALGAETVRLAFDADVQTKPHVAGCLVECASALRAQGYDVAVERWPIEQGKGIDDLLAAGRTPEVLVGDDALDYLSSIIGGAAHINGTTTPVESRLPADTRPLAGEVATRNEVVLPFPVEVFPLRLRRYALLAADSLGCPVDLVAMPMLCIAATGIGATRALEAKPGWWESARIYCATVAPPGSGKTPAESVVSRPVFRLQNQFRQQYRQATAEYEAAETLQRSQGRERRSSNEPTANSARTAQAAADASTPCGDIDVHGASANNSNSTEPAQRPKPVLRRITTVDATTESLAPILMQNPRGIAMIKDELSGWIRSLDQYKGGKGSDRQFYLSCWSGQPAIVDRKSQTEPIIVPGRF